MTFESSDQVIRRSRELRAKQIQDCSRRAAHIPSPASIIFNLNNKGGSKWDVHAKVPGVRAEKRLAH